MQVHDSKGQMEARRQTAGQTNCNLGQNSQPPENKKCPARLREVALKACSVVGKGLYGVDIKEVNGDYVVVEVNDNPSIYAGYEDSIGPRHLPENHQLLIRIDQRRFRHLFIITRIISSAWRDYCYARKSPQTT